MSATPTVAAPTIGSTTSAVADAVSSTTNERRAGEWRANHTNVESQDQKDEEEMLEKFKVNVEELASHPVQLTQRQLDDAKKLLGLNTKLMQVATAFSWQTCE